MADFKPQPKPKNPLDNQKLRLTAVLPGTEDSKEKRYSSLVWGFVTNNPRITVYTNDPTEKTESKGYGKISANLDMPTFYAFLAILDNVIKHDGEIKEKIENKNYIFPGGKRSEKPVVTSNLWIGKDKDGIVWMSVTAPPNQNRPVIKFPFVPTIYHHLIHGDGTPYKESEISVIYAKAYLHILHEMLGHMAISHWVEPPPPQQKGNFGGGNRQASSSSDGMEDDLPF